MKDHFRCIGRLYWFASSNRVNYIIHKIHRIILWHSLSCMVEQVVETHLFIELWHISHTTKGANMKCFAIKAMTLEKCKNVISSDIHAPCYHGPFNLPSFNEWKSNFKFLMCMWYWDACHEFGMWLCFPQANNSICFVSGKQNHFHHYPCVYVKQWRF